MQQHLRAITHFNRYSPEEFIAMHQEDLFKAVSEFNNSTGLNPIRDVLGEYSRNTYDNILSLAEFLRSPSPTPPLVVAAYHKQYRIFETLIKNGANSNQVAEKSDHNHPWSGMSAFDAIAQGDIKIDLNAFALLLHSINDKNITAQPDNHGTIIQALNAHERQARALRHQIFSQYKPPDRTPQP